MNKATLLATAAAAVALVATPALARDSMHSGMHSKSYKSRVHNPHHANARSTDRFAQRDNNWNRRDNFWPAATAGAIAAGAVATAGAIATAPVRSGYYDNGYYGGYNQPYGGVAYRSGYRYDNTYASMDEGFGPYNYNGTAIPGSPSFDARNGFTCRPGTIIKLNGQPTLCQ